VRLGRLLGGDRLFPIHSSGKPQNDTCLSTSPALPKQCACKLEKRSNIHNADETVDYLDQLHIWVDSKLKSYVDADDLEYRFNHPTVEH
jgi:hypothetical protein